ncbi:MAG: hypothetical protein ACJ8CB_20320 [Ktedonobacteraceae bacterium]|jgi:hypothetical protein
MSWKPHQLPQQMVKTPCQAVDNYRNAVYAGSKTAVAPNPDSACATSFGNTDTESAIVNY